MPSTPSPAARLAATALLRGPFEAKALAKELARLRGRRTKALQELAELLVAMLGTGSRPRERDVAALLTDSDAFARAFANRTISLADLPRARMQPARGAPRTWRLPRIVTLPALARWLAVEPSDLHELCAPTRRERAKQDLRRVHYHYEWIPRRAGLPRLLEAPKQRLKAVQRRILTGLLARVPTHDAAHGFVRGRSPVTFTAPHARKHCVLRMDVRDFFASFRRARVLRVFLTLGYPEPVAAALADLCTTRTPRAVCAGGLGPPMGAASAETLRSKLQHRHLPQGAPTSPALANLCAFSIDARLTGLARKFAATYTRYADDLLFSGDAPFARDAARCEVHAAAVLLECGLEVAHQKTKFMHRSASQRAAGLVINQHPAIPRRERELLEAVLVNCVRRGVAEQNRDGHADFRAHLRGRIARVAHVHAAAGTKLLALFDQIRW